MIIEDRPVTNREITEAAGISIEQVLNILRKYLGMRNLSDLGAAFAILGDSHAIISKECLALSNRDMGNFLCRGQNMDLSQYTGDPEAVDTSDYSWRIEQEEGQGGSVGQKGHEHIFWDVHGIIHTD